jgi:hypothetical protein
VLQAQLSRVKMSETPTQTSHHSDFRTIAHISGSVAGLVGADLPDFANVAVLGGPLAL